MQLKKSFLMKLLAMMLSVIMVVGSLSIAASAPGVLIAPTGLVNITVAGTDAVNAYPVFTPTEPTVVYTPAIAPNASGIITYRFSFTPTYHNPASGGSYTRMHILAPGHAGDGRANQLEIPWLRRRAPIEFRINHTDRTFMVLSESFVSSAPNIMYDQWEVGYTYYFVVTMDVSDAANDNITFTIETFDQDGYSFSNPDTSVWTDLPLRTVGQGNQTEYDAGQLTVFAADRLAFADGIGGVTIGRFGDANHLSDFVFTVPAADYAYIPAGPDYPTTDITTVLNTATFNVVGSVTYDPIVEPCDDGYIAYTFRLTIDELDAFGGDVEIFFVPPNMPAGLANRAALRLNAGIRLAFRNLTPEWAPPYGGVDMLIGNNATNLGAGTSIPGGTFIPEQEYEIFVEINTNATPNQFRLTVRESGIANPATILPTTTWQNRFNLENSGVWADFSDGIGAVHVVNSANTMAVTFNVPAADFLDYEPGTPPPPRDTPMTFQIGPGMEFDDVATFNFNALIPGDVVEIFPNVDNAPYRSTGATAFQHVINISANGTEENPITIRGMANQYGERPILQGTFRFQHAVVMINGDHVTLDNLVIDGGLLCFLDWLNADAAPDNRFALVRGHAPAPAFPGTVLTLDNLHEYFNATVYETFFHHGSAVNWVVPGAGERYTPHSIMYDDVFHAARRPAGDPRGINRDHFASRGIFHSSGDGLRVTNSLVIGSGTGLAGSNNGAGHLFVCSNEFGFNGMTLAGHNIYLNSDNARHQDLVVTIQNNFIHNAVGTMGFRTRVGRINLHNNFFLDNANGQVDLTTVSLNDNIATLYNQNNQPPHFSCRFGYRNHNEVMGNLFVLTELFNQDHVSVGGAGMTLEVTHGRYRFVNNTFVALAGGAMGLGWNGGSPNLFIRARFGIESIEMYNNIFYAAFENALVPFGDHIGEACVRARLAQGGINDDGTTFDANTWYEFNPTIYEGNRNHWRFGERQVAGANNWVSHGSVGTQMPRVVGAEAQRFWWGGIPYEWDNTVRGQQGENPFVDIANLDFRVRSDSTAAFTGSPVGSYAEFMSLAEYNTRLAANELPVFSSWQISGSTASRIEGITPPWVDLSFPNPTASNIANPPINFRANPNPLALGNIWDVAARADSAAPQIGAFYTTIPERLPVFGWDIFNNGQGGTQYPNPNASLADAGLIRMWTQLDGASMPVPFAAASTLVAIDQDGECAMEFVHVHRIWVDGQGFTNYFASVDVNKNGDWQYINMYITVYGQTVPVLLVNAQFEEPADDVTVTFVVEAGAVGVYAAVTTTVEVPAGEEIPAETIPSTVARTGFYFAGWYPSDPAEFGVVTEDITFTARFNPLFHDVTFEAGNGGELTPTSFGLVVNIRDGFTFWTDRVPTPVADYGYEFVEWTPYNPAGFVVREDMTFTAVFAPVIVTPVEPRIVSVTPVPVVVEQGGEVQIVVTTQGMPNGAWIDLNVSWRAGLSIVGGPRFYVVDNQATITIAADAAARLGRDGFAVAARVAGDWGSVVILDSYTFVIEVQ